MSVVDQSLVNAFFNSGFEEPAEIVLESGTKNILGHFYDKYETAKMLDKDVESSSPMYECRSSDIPGVKQSNKITCRGIEFYVHEVKADGDGFTQLTLYYGND